MIRRSVVKKSVMRSKLEKLKWVKVNGIWWLTTNKGRQEPIRFIYRPPINNEQSNDTIKEVVFYKFREIPKITSDFWIIERPEK